jgi:glycosyltransferase involved in cell wall biosynthesis
VKTNSIVILDQASGYLQIDILEALAEKYEKRVIIAGSIVERSKKLPDDVRWHKIIKYDRSTSFKRIYTWLVATIQMYLIVLTRYRKAHLFIITNPPFAVFISLLLRNPYSVLIYDVYPDVLVNYKIFKGNSWFIKYWRRLNRKIFRNSEQLYTISEGMKALLSNYVNEAKVKVVPIWSDSEFLKPIPKFENQFLKNLGLTDEFVVQYSGNLGRTHDVDVLVELAIDLKNEKNLHFVIIGQGDKWRLLEQKIADYKLENCSLLPWQPVEVLPQSLAAPDIGVVSLGSEASKMSVPSKTFNLFSVGVPILAIASDDSELADLLKRYNAGVTLDSNQVKEMKDFILTLKNDREKLLEYKSNSLNASRDFTPENARLFVA